MIINIIVRCEVQQVLERLVLPIPILSVRSNQEIRYVIGGPVFSARIIDLGGHTSNYPLSLCQPAEPDCELEDVLLLNLAVEIQEL